MIIIWWIIAFWAFCLIGSLALYAVWGVIHVLGTWAEKAGF